MNKVFLNQNTYNPEIHGIGEINLKPSVTVPDQSLTIQQILELFTRGIDPPSIMKNGVGYDNPDWDDLDVTQNPAFDIIDAKKGLDEIRAKIEESKKPKPQPLQKTLDDAISEAQEVKE